MEKIVLFFFSVIITFILSIISFLAIYILIMLYHDITNSHPEHPTMPLGAVVFSFIATIPISLIILYKVYNWLTKRYL